MTKLITDYTYVFSKDTEPVEKVELGEEVIFKTLDCFSNQTDSEDDLITSIDMTKVNPATGPVYVNGAEEGDTLVVKIKDIQVASQGVAVTIPEIGPLIDDAEIRTKILKVEDGKIKYNNISMDLDPMVGVLGVAPKEGSIACGLIGDHGGNMDNKLIRKNTTLYLPVNVDGALFGLGDLHAKMADGELSGAGLEIPGEVTVEFDLIKGRSIKRPIHETEDAWYTIAAAGNYEDTLKLVSEDMQKLIVDAYGWDKTDAYIYLSLEGDVEICQATMPSGWDVSLRLGVPKQKDKPLL